MLDPNATSGIIELSIRGEWRSVCDHQWNNANARVACRQLGLPYSCKLSVFYVYVSLSDSKHNVCGGVATNERSPSTILQELLAIMNAVPTKAVAW